MQRPTYLQNAPDLSDRAVQGLGTVLPPHVSIRGNKFTLIDGAGNKKVLGDTMDFLVADIGDHTGKMYYANAQWTPDSDDPPDCWSMNGVGPSREAINPQARTCDECPHNVRGSRISALGSSVKACRDEVVIAIVHPQFAAMLFQFKVTPGSFKNWRKHVEEAKNVSPQDNVGTILTRATFDPEQSGVVVFKAVAYPDQTTWEARTKAVTTKSTDILVGRNDRPRELAAPTTVVSQGAGYTAAPEGTRPLQTATAQIAAQPSTATAPAQTGFGATTASPSEPQPEQQRRKRRTKAEIEADNAAKAAPAGAPFGGGQQMAPFRPEAPQPTQGNGAAFGISSNAPGPSADISAALDAAFGKAQSSGGFGS